VGRSQRRSSPYFGEHPAIVFPSTAGQTILAGQWRRVSDKRPALSRATQTVIVNVPFEVVDKLPRTGAAAIVGPQSSLACIGRERDLVLI
jgi:hypothetical protein